MKYKVGDKVRVKPLEWFRANCRHDFGGYEFRDSLYYFTHGMCKLCGKEVKIKSVSSNDYSVEGLDRTAWEDWMFEDEEERKNKNMYIIIDKEDMGLVTKGLDFKDCFFNTLCEAEVEAQKYAKDMNISVDKLCVLSMTDNTDVYEFKSSLSHAYELSAIKEK